ncbi:helix-turn-helix domain-containing protein [Glutamicibacter sp. 287]
MLTLSTYLETSQHHARTCAEIHFHANTLYNRLISTMVQRPDGR